MRPFVGYNFGEYLQHWLDLDIMHDPFAMRPFVGYNFGEYLQHWLDLEQPGRYIFIFDINIYLKFYASRQETFG